MRISDWSSYVCSSDLEIRPRRFRGRGRRVRKGRRAVVRIGGPVVGARRSAGDGERQRADAGRGVRGVRQGDRARRQRPARALFPRSEEHTSELQSLMRISYAVFCLKKNNKKTTTYDTSNTHT